jgi:ABC-type Mn2+/Zn2+ transport system permease subunit
MEIIWIATGALCIAAGTRYAFTNNSSKMPVFALMALICFVFAWIRHRQRKKS